MARSRTTFLPGNRANPNGRPRKSIAKRDLDVITKLGARGCREKDIARAVGVSEPTWMRIKSTDTDVLAALNAGRQLMHDALVNKLFEKAMNGDTIALIFSLKAFFAYRDVPKDDAEASYQP